MNEENCFGMDNQHSLSPLGSGYEAIRLDPISQIVLFTQENLNYIKKEYKKLKTFYKTNPEAFLFSLTSTKQKLEDKENLSEFDKITLEEIDRMIINYDDIDYHFSFQEDFLLDSFQKIYTQMAKFDRRYVKQSSTVEILFYTIDTTHSTILDRNVPLGELFEDGTVNTGSKLQIEILKINPLNFIYLYQTLLN